MPRNAERERKRAPKEGRARTKKRVCAFCQDRVVWVDYKDVATLRRFVSERGKIRSRRVTGNCRQHQRDVQIAIKTARELALLPYVQRAATDRGLPRPRAEETNDEDIPEAVLARYEEEPDQADGAL
jgi:small subunit ribosomal protein S18